MARAKKPAPRRQFGNIQQLPSKKWRARYRVDGTWRNAPSTFDTREAAASWLTGIEADLSRGTWTDPLAGAESFESFATAWLDNRPELRDTTVRKYRKLLKTHLFPAFGALALSDVTIAEIRPWYNGLSAEHKSTADDAYRLLRNILKQALNEERINRMPLGIRGAGSTRSPERPSVSIPELQAAVAAIPERYRACFLLASWCSLRISECQGLQRADVDLTAGTVTVRRARVHGGHGPMKDGPVKTPTSRRTVAIPPNVLPAIEEHLAFFVGPEPTSYLFTIPAGTPVSYTELWRQWNNARTVAGIPQVHIHDLRGAGLTWFAISGGTVAELLRRAGQTDFRVGLRYQRATADRDRAIAEAMGKLASDVV